MEQRIDFDKFAKGDPEAAKVVHRVMQQAVIDRNSISVHEFMYYLPLFLKEGHTSQGMQKNEELGKQYMERIDYYNPVIIYNETIDKEGNVKRDNVYILPPLFNKVHTINVLGDGSGDLMTAFMMACRDSTDEFDIKKRRLFPTLLNAINLAQNKEELMQRSEMYTKLADAVTQQQNGDYPEAPAPPEPVVELDEDYSAFLTDEELKEPDDQTTNIPPKAAEGDIVFEEEYVEW